MLIAKPEIKNQCSVREEDPNVAVHLARLADDARLFSDFAAVSGEALLLAARSGNALCCERLMKAHPIVMREAFRFWVSDITSDSLNRAQLTALEHSVRKGGEVRLGNGWIVERSGGSLVLIHDPSRPTRSNRSQKK